MRKLVAVISLFFVFCASAQNGAIGLKAGIVDVDLIDIGFNTEIYYEYELVKNLYASISLGYITQNSFPDIFDKPSYDLINGVSPEVNDFILSLPASSIRPTLDWRKTNVGYAQFYVKYQLPISLLGFKVNVFPGIAFVHGEGASFGLRQFNFNFITDVINSYTPQFSIRHYDIFTWTFGLGVSRELSEKIYLEIDAKYMQSGFKAFEESFSLVRLGVGRRF